MKNFVAALLLIVTIPSFAQQLNNYKYAIVPMEFGFLDAPDQYRMNTLTKLFMEKYGFVTYFAGDVMPLEVAGDNCSKVFVDVVSNSTLFTTKLSVVLRDCTNQVLYTSPEGTSREKDNKVAYPHALREAFYHLGSVNYKYNGGAKNAAVATGNAKTAATVETLQATKPANLDDQFFAQPIEGGYQVVDTTPKVVLLLKNTSAEGVFIAERTDAKGIVFNKQGKWFFEYYAAGKLVSELMKIKF
ncbi:MAG TPA: hypothetical protein VFQ50_11495 [Flavobacterium sp.]|jgi:hypothetical protein|nr:hypothetical protein [Flavobacterium sp.]